VARTRDSFFRPKARYAAQPRVLVVCEDTKSSRSYLQDASQHFRANVHVEIVHSGYTDPKGIVAAALKRAKEFEHLYCVIDRDAHENFDAAVHLAGTSNKLTMIVSHPCFEYWLLLHFNESRRAYMRAGNRSAADCLIADLLREPGMDGYKKGNVARLFQSLHGERFDAARRRSPRVLLDAVRVNNMNPSTALHVLIDHLERLGEPQPSK
jgi:hypothetical protein